jgi:putative phosphoribosyl transferase
LRYLRAQDPLVVGLPRGGVPVAFEVARALDAPLDVIVVRKLGVPFQPELAMGAVGEGGTRVVDERIVAAAGLSPAELALVEERERAEVGRRTLRFRGARPPLSLSGRVVVIVDDGLATGSTARAACQAARAKGAARIVLAVPVAPADTVVRLCSEADEVVALQTPEGFSGVGHWYQDFTQTSDQEVLDLLESAAMLHAEPPAEGSGLDPQIRHEEVTLTAAGVALAGRLSVPEDASGLVVFAHGSGSSRHSPRNRSVAGVLNRAGLATLLFDLLTHDEERHRANVFDVDLLAARLDEATRDARRGFGWVGYFGASTGAAAALVAAAEPDADVAAVVSRGGRPDLAGPRLADVRAPTLLIVGSRDEAVLELNRQALARLRCTSSLAVIPGATHLFEEPGTLSAAADCACEWFLTHGGRPPESPA